MYLDHLLVLLLPHLIQKCQSLVACLFPSERIQSLHQYLLHTWVSSHPQQFLDNLHELRINIPRECLSGVIGQDSDEHNAIVLNVGFGVVVFGEELSDYVGSFLGGRGGRFASFDNGRKVENFFTLADC